MNEKNGNVDIENINELRVEWRKKSWTIPDLNGGKQIWFSLVKNLVELIGSGQAIFLDAKPEIPEISSPQTWRQYMPFLKGIRLVKNQSGSLHLSDLGINFQNDPSKIHLANLIQNRIRLFGEFLSFLSLTPATVEEVDNHFCKTYDLSWKNLSHTRRRMDWLEVLELIEGVGNRKWRATAVGKSILKNWSLVSPSILESFDSDLENIEIIDPPHEIAVLLQNLANSPEKHRKRNTYNIWVPSPNRIDNLRIIVQAATDRITRIDFFKFIENEFKLKTSSAESMLPFLKASGLLEEVGRNIYSATSAAKAWLETGNDLDFIRILHSNMQFVGEMIRASKNDIIRNDLYARAKPYGLNKEKTRWIVGFMLEAGLLEEPQYLHLKATSTGLVFVSSLPLSEEIPLKESQEDITSPSMKEIVDSSSSELDKIVNQLSRSSRDPGFNDLLPGLAFEEAIADIFRFMGFNSERVGGSGDTDVIARWKDNKGKIFTAIVDGKSKSNGKVSHSDISDIAIDTHKEKNNADFVGIVGPGFSGDTIQNHSMKKSYALITGDQLSEIAQAAESIGLSPQEISLIFQVPDGSSQLDELIIFKQRELDIISVVISRLNQEQEILGGLSPRDLFFMSRETNISPSLNELLDVVEILSNPAIGALRVATEARAAENTTYVLNDAKKAANRLRALATTIDKALHD